MVNLTPEIYWCFFLQFFLDVIQFKISGVLKVLAWLDNKYKFYRTILKKNNQVRV